MRKRTTWLDNINGYPCEFVNWGFKEVETDRWSYYIYFTPMNTTPNQWAALLAIPAGWHSVDYYSSWLAGLDWRGGITYASREYDSRGRVCAVKAGCDYTYLYDEGYTDTLDDIVRDCLATISSIPTH